MREAEQLLMKDRRVRAASWNSTLHQDVFATSQRLTCRVLFGSAEVFLGGIPSPDTADQAMGRMINVTAEEVTKLQPARGVMDHVCLRMQWTTTSASTLL
jgi:hypothetical protein